jgi:RNA polymerase sigma-70 factor, ECF subfamily
MTFKNLNQKQISNIISEKPRAILIFYKNITPYLKNYFKTRVNCQKDCEELIHDTLLSIIDSLPQFKGNSKFTTWALSIAHHELVDYYRRKKIKTLLFSHFPFLENIIDKALGPQLALEEKEAKHKIYLTLKNLSEGYSQILRLRYLEGLSVSAIALEFNITYKAAESRLSRARLAFAKEFVRQRPQNYQNSQILDSTFD